MEALEPIDESVHIWTNTVYGIIGYLPATNPGEARGHWGSPHQRMSRQLGKATGYGRADPIVITQRRQRGNTPTRTRTAVPCYERNEESHLTQVSSRRNTESGLRWLSA
jgi:hypothetical protein